MRLMVATILGRSSNRRCSINSAIFAKLSLASLRICAARSLAAWASTGSSASICSMVFFRSATSSIIAKPLRRQSHQWHSSFAVVPWRSEPLRLNLSDYRRSCRNRDRGRQSQRWQHSSLGTARASCTYQAALIVTGNHSREQQTIVAEPLGASLACRTGDEGDVAQKTAPAIGKTDADRCPAGWIQTHKLLRNAQLPSLQANGSRDAAR